MGNHALALGLGSQFDWEGKTYNMSPWTYEIMGKFELYMENETLKSLKSMKPYLDPDEYTRLVLNTKKDIDLGAFTFGSEEMFKAVNSPKHLRYMAWLCLQAHHPEIDLEWVRELFNKDPELLLRKMEEANNDPKELNPKKT